MTRRKERRGKKKRKEKKRKEKKRKEKKRKDIEHDTRRVSQGAGKLRNLCIRQHGCMDAWVYHNGDGVPVSFFYRPSVLSTGVARTHRCRWKRGNF